MSQNFWYPPGSSTSSSITANQGTANTVGNAWPVKITDGVDTALVTAAGLLQVDGSGAVQPVSGTVAATQSGVWTIQPGNTANTTAWKVDGSAVTQPVSAASLPLPSGAATEASLAKLPLAQGSTTASQSGPLAQGAVTTSGPSYSNAQTSPLSLTTSGNLRTDPTQNVLRTYSANMTNGSGNLDVDCSAMGTVMLSVTGTWTGTISWNGSMDASTYSASNPSAQGVSLVALDGAPVLSITSNNQIAIPCAGLKSIRIVNTVVTGTAVVKANAAPAESVLVGALANMYVSQAGTWSVGLSAGSATIGALTANQSVNQTQMNGVAVSTGNGVVGTGVQRVAIASDNTAFSTNSVQSGTWTVQPGNTANTTAWLVKEQRSSTATLTNVNDSASSQSLLASNSSRLGATFFNDSTSILYLKFGTTASATSYTVQLPSNGYYELPGPNIYTGAIDGIWSADSTGAVRITELS